MTVVDHPGMTNRLVNAPKSIDIADMEIWQAKFAIPQGVTQAVDTRKIKDWEQLTPLYTKGTFTRTGSLTPGRCAVPDHVSRRHRR